MRYLTALIHRLCISCVMDTYRIVPTIGGVNLLEAAPDGRTVISRKFPTEERAKAWLLTHLSRTNGPSMNGISEPRRPIAFAATTATISAFQSFKDRYHCEADLILRDEVARFMD